MQRLSAVSKTVGERARLALDLVGYDPELAGAMSYTFGSTIVCDDPETAKKVTFDRNIGLRSVTVDGDVYDPSGTLSGGSKTASEDILIKVQHLIEAELNLADAKTRLREADAAWNSDKTRKKRDEWKRLSRELEIKEHELQLLQDQLGESSAAKVRIMSLNFHYSLIAVLVAQTIGGRLAGEDRKTERGPSGGAAETA